MSIVKTFSVGNGDMFYIKHNTNNFTIIDCCIPEDREEEIIKEIKIEYTDKDIVRFISTHPDQDHITGLKLLFEKISIPNFYCVKNDISDGCNDVDFEKYVELRNSDKAYFLRQGCARKWLNISDDEQNCAGIKILWPDTKNEIFANSLSDIENKTNLSPNNISPIIKYSIENNASFLWMGDMESDFMESVEAELLKLDLKADILFAPHHGRDSGKIPEKILRNINPKIIVIGKAPSENLNYYNGYDTITQNTAKDIWFDCNGNTVDVYATGNVKCDILRFDSYKYKTNYKGTLTLDQQ